MRWQHCMMQENHCLLEVVVLGGAALSGSLYERPSCSECSLFERGPFSSLILYSECDGNGMSGLLERSLRW